MARPYVRRELRRLQINYQDISFFEYRDLALELLQNVDAPSQGSYENPNTFQAIDKVASKSNPHIDLLQQLVEGQAQLKKTLEAMVFKQEQSDALLHELTRPVNNLCNERFKPRQPNNRPQCSYCSRRGHDISDCYKRQNDEARASSGMGPEPKVYNRSSNQSQSRRPSSGKVLPLPWRALWRRVRRCPPQIFQNQ